MGNKKIRESFEEGMSELGTAGRRRKAFPGRGNRYERVTTYMRAPSNLFSGSQGVAWRLLFQEVCEGKAVFVIILRWYVPFSLC